MSNSGEFGQREGALKKAAEYVEDARKALLVDSKKLDDQLQEAKNKWHGQGATAFFDLHRVWTDKQTVIVGALDRFSSSLGQTERDNVSTDDSTRGNIANLNGRLG